MTKEELKQMLTELLESGEIKIEVYEKNVRGKAQASCVVVIDGQIVCGQ